MLQSKRQRELSLLSQLSAPSLQLGHGNKISIYFLIYFSNPRKDLDQRRQKHGVRGGFLQSQLSAPSLKLGHDNKISVCFLIHPSTLKKIQ